MHACSVDTQPNTAATDDSIARGVPVDGENRAEGPEEHHENERDAEVREV